jgi:cephalosporin-C deacetylase-like acetyl esterase
VKETDPEKAERSMKCGFGLLPANRSLMSCLVVLALGAWPTFSLAEEEKPSNEQLAKWLRDLDAKVLPADGDKARELARMLSRNVRSRVQAANQRENRAWQQVKDRAAWKKYRDARLRALRDSLGHFPSPPKSLKVHVTRQIKGDGYRIENLVFETRPGLVVTANLYSPARPSKSMPGILISHSHHNPKTQGELQDMGMTWARSGCLVLVLEHLGHGERRQHPFRSAKDYPHPFRPGRQDYYFRYPTGFQLQLVGESLMGWMVWDLMRGMDVLLARPGIDKDRIILLGAVAGGGDPAGVTAALDPRIKAVAPFNFGGPQPDYAIAADADRNFYFFGVPDWESTRCLRLGAQGGFAHWLIVGSVAPRRLIYAHEFAWNQKRDPVWPRLQKVFGWYDAADHLTATFGRGSVKGKPPESTHCNNIGPLHRSKIYPALKRWFDMPVPKEYSLPRTSDELTCLTPALARKLRPRPVHALAADLADKQLTTARRRLAKLSPTERRKHLRDVWARLLGDVTSAAKPKLLGSKKQEVANVTVERLSLEVEPGIVVPMLLLVPQHKEGTQLPVVLGLAQDGKQAFLKQRSDTLAVLLAGGVAVCLPDVRGTGETQPAGVTRRRGGADTSLSAAEWMLGQTLVGARLRDLRSVLRYLRSRTDLDRKRVALWGDSFAAPNPKDRDLAVPLDAQRQPSPAEPLGGLLALLGALYEEEVRAVSIRGGLVSYLSLLQSPFCYVPHDALVPGVFEAGDLCDLAAAAAPRALSLQNLVDGLNRQVPADQVAWTFAPARAAYRSLKAASRLRLEGKDSAAGSTAKWLLRQLRTD